MPRIKTTSYDPNAAPTAHGTEDYPLNLFSVVLYARRVENAVTAALDDDSWEVLALHCEEDCPLLCRWSGPTLVVRNLRTLRVYYLPALNCTIREHWGEPWPIPFTPFKIHE